MHYSMVKQHCSNFRIITTIFSGVQIFKIFTANSLGLPHQNFLTALFQNGAQVTLCAFIITVNFLNIQTPKKFIVITLKIGTLWL